MSGDLCCTKTPISYFMSRYPGKTAFVYRTCIFDFLDFVNGKRIRGAKYAPSDLPRYEEFAHSYLTRENFNYGIDVIAFARNLSDRKVPPKTAHLRLAGTREFLGRYGIEISKNDARDIRRLKPKGGRRTDFEYIDKAVLAEVLAHLNSKGRAFVLTLASSGIRIGEALSLKWTDVSFPDRRNSTTHVASLFIRNTKTGYSRKVYITHECEDALIEWRKEYPDFCKWAEKMTNNLKKDKWTHQDNVFPFTDKTAYEIWNDALKKSGHYNFDQETKRVRMNVHRLRNFFSVQVASAVGNQVSEILLGHTDKYGGAYTGRSEVQMEAEYLKAESYLTIGSVTHLEKINEAKFENLTTENKGLKDTVNDLQTQLVSMQGNYQRQLLSIQGDYDKIVEAITSMPGYKGEATIQGSQSAVKIKSTRIL